MKKIHKFFSKDLLHILGAVGIFVAFLISIAYKQVGIGALIAAWLIAIAMIGVAWITDIRKADLLKNGKIVSGKVNAVDWKRHLLWTVPLVLVQSSREQGNTYKGDY